ncbi:MAG TPA: hypothetical protein VFA48_08795 [Gammaproteobacteria bacterium]|nr:hypothetical protein [Gammaproteobacteria bacterium]
MDKSCVHARVLNAENISKAASAALVEAICRTLEVAVWISWTVSTLLAIVVTIAPAVAGAVFMVGFLPAVLGWVGVALLVVGVFWCVFFGAFFITLFPSSPTLDAWVDAVGDRINARFQR